MTREELSVLVAAVRLEVRRSLGPWLTESEVADRLRVSTHWVRENRKLLGAKPLANKKGRNWRYHINCVDRAFQDIGIEED